MTSIADLQNWFERGVQNDYYYMVVICDTYDHSDFPVYYDNKDDCLRRIDNPGDMARVMEVYDLSMDMQTQLNERRAFHPPSRFNIPKMDAKVLAEMEGDFDVWAGPSSVVGVDPAKPGEDRSVTMYPTPEAYDAACEALWKHRDRADRAERELAELREKYRQQVQETHRMWVSAMNWRDRAIGSGYINES